MKLILTNRLNPAIVTEYVDPTSINCNRAEDICEEDEIGTNGIDDDDMLMVVALRGGEPAIFKADEWTVKILPGEGTPKRDFLSQDEIAEYYGVSRSTVHRQLPALSKKHPEAMRYLGNQVRIHLPTYDALLTEKGKLK